MNLCHSFNGYVCLEFYNLIIINVSFTSDKSFAIFLLNNGIKLFFYPVFVIYFTTLVVLLCLICIIIFSSCAAMIDSD